MNSGNRLHSATDGALKLNRDITSVGFDVGLILFSTEAELVCAPTRTGIESSLQGITCTGSTNLTAALRLALSNLSDRRQTRRVVIVATDGYPDDADTALEIAAVVKTEGIEILVVGTDDADRRFLEKLASRPESAIVTSGSQIGTGIVAVSKLLLPP